MTVLDQIIEYISSQPEQKRKDMEQLHALILEVMPGCKLWFDNGKNSENQTITNPTIGYGFYTIKYATGKTRNFFKIGMSANKTGISIYVIGIGDKNYLAKTYGTKIGKANVSGYCIRFKKLSDIDVHILKAAIRYGIKTPND